MQGISFYHGVPLNCPLLWAKPEKRHTVGCSISGLGFFLEHVHLSSEHVLAFKLSKFLEDTLVEIHAPGAVWSPSPTAVAKIENTWMVARGTHIREAGRRCASWMPSQSGGMTPVLQEVSLYMTCLT